MFFGRYGQSKLDDSPDLIKKVLILVDSTRQMQLPGVISGVVVERQVPQGPYQDSFP